MSFVDVLRGARSSRAAVLHEFWTQYAPGMERVHAFFEGHDDEVFYRRFLEQYVPAGSRLYGYRCDGKQRVYEAFSQITARYPAIRSVLFFVDKDLDDILGLPWPTDPRVFVTDVYSIENYLVSSGVLESFYRDAVRLTGVTFETSTLVARFEQELGRFHCLSVPLMGWILALRRRELKPNLGDLDLAKLFIVSEECAISALPRGRIEYLNRVSGVGGSAVDFRQVSQACRELRRLPAKRVVRGKFEAWFFVAFWKRLTKQLQALSREAKGNVKFKLSAEESSLVPSLVGHARIPRPLELFLELHFPRGGQLGEAEASSPRSDWRGKVGLWVKRMFRAIGG